MRTSTSAFLLMLLMPILVSAQNGLTKVKNQAFGPNEVLEYRVH